jgi:diguanylate cyclase (GGDEF)-like protein/PAS domain S-box-containing protein
LGINTTSWYPPNGSGSPICVGVIQDISDRVTAEQACQKSEKLLGTLMDNIDLGISLVGEDHTILALNRAQARMFHKNPIEFSGKKCFREFEKRDGICLHCPGVRALKEGKPHIVETEGVLDDGSRFLVRIRALPVFDPDGKARKFIEVVEDITQTRAMEEELRQSQDRLNYLAHHNQLTDLPNRTLLYDRIKHGIDRARRNKDGLAVIVFQLDRFKRINKSLGFEVGNQALREVSDRLKSLLRTSDSLSHIGGIEFGLMIDKGDNLVPSAKVAKKILSALSDKLFVVSGQELRITASVGISHYPEDGADVETLLRAAESARINAKEQGGNGYEFYQPEKGEAARRFLELESLLYVALKEDQLTAYYQPQINPVSGQLIGIEALARWQHPEKGIVSPGEFIPVAEETSLIFPLGQRMLEIACRQAKEWEPILPPHFRVAVNVSALQITRGHLGHTVKAILQKTGLPSAHLEIEITESALVKDPNKALEVIHALKDMGVSVALDDFGTGYSALSYLKNFPFDRIKVDQSFIANIPHGSHELAIVESIFSLGRKLGIEVVAEGVETAEHLKCLTEMGCTAIQGYYFSRPLDAEMATRNLTQWLGLEIECPFRT